MQLKGLSLYVFGLVCAGTLSAPLGAQAQVEASQAGPEDAKLTIENEAVLARFDGDMALIDFLCKRSYPAHQEGNVQLCEQRARAGYIVRYLPDYAAQAKYVPAKE